MKHNDTRTGDILEPFFHEAKTAEPAPRNAFLNAIFADAAEVSEARRMPQLRRQPSLWNRMSSVLDGLGGWRGATALAGSAALGFWIGTSDLTEIDAYLGLSSSTIESADGPVMAFFDLASAEG
jgi:hypothetical protein